jgi:hypothetical protein
MNPYQPGEDNQDPYEVGYKAGAASRNAEIAELKYALGFDWDKFQASQEALRENMQLLSKATSDRAVLLSACETFMSHGVCEVSYYAIREALAKVRKP